MRESEEADRGLPAVTTQWAPPAVAPRPQSRAGAVVLIVVGSVLALMSVGLLGAGGFLMWADHTQRDASGYLTSGTGPISAPTYAIASPNVDLNFSSRAWPDTQAALGKVRITASSASPAGVFIGIAPRADALRYLNGVAYDGLSDLRFLPYRVTLTPHGGGAPAAPTSQAFWRAEASGTGTQNSHLAGRIGAVDRRLDERRRFTRDRGRCICRGHRPVPVRDCARPAHRRRHRAGGGTGAAHPRDWDAQPATAQRTVARRCPAATTGAGAIGSAQLSAPRGGSARRAHESLAVAREVGAARFRTTSSCGSCSSRCSCSP